MNDNVEVKFTECGKKKVEDLCDKAWNWMEGENTVGDFFTALFDELAEEWFGEDILSMSIAKIESDKDAQLMVLKRICESPLVDVFKKVENPEELL